MSTATEVATTKKPLNDQPVIDHEWGYMISPHGGVDLEEDLNELCLIALSKMHNPEMPRRIGGTFHFYNVIAKREFTKLLELQGFGYDLTFIPEPETAGH